MNVSFAYPWVLYFLWLAPAAAVAWRWLDARAHRRLAALVSPEMRRKLMPPASRARAAWQTAAFAAGLFFLLLAAARPQWGERDEAVFQRGRDLIVALDVSRSMLANDVHPNRLRRAKADLMDLVRELRGDRVGLLAFRRKGILLCPLTTDYAYFRQALDAAGPESAPRGETDLGDAIAKALDAFDNEAGSHKAIVLVSDGEDLTGKAKEAAQQAAKRLIPIFTVGIGDSRGARIPDQERRGAFLRHRDADVVTRLDNDTMLSIAQTTGGAYIPLATASTASTTLGMLYRDHLRKITAQDLEETLQRRRVERFQIFLLPGVLLLLAAAMLSRGRLAAAPRRPPAAPRRPPAARAAPLAAAAWLLFFSIAPPARAAATNAPAVPDGLDAPAGPSPSTNTAASAAKNVPPGRAGARVAQRLYALGKYEAAAEAFERAAHGATYKSQYDFRFNAAVALFKAGKFRQAADRLADLARSRKDHRDRTAAALGTALYRDATASPDGEPSPESLRQRAGALRDAGEAFKDALRERTDDATLRRNLAATLAQWPAADERARIAELVAQHQNTPAEALAEVMLQAQRALTLATPPAFTNDTPARLAQLEALAEAQKANADLWIPLKGKLLQAMQQSKDDQAQQRMAAIQQAIEATRDNMKAAAEKLRDLDAAAFPLVAGAEASAYQFWKAIASYGQLLREDLLRQTNAILATLDAQAARPPPPERDASEQREAEHLTRLFAQRFEMSVPEAGLPAPSAGAHAPPAAAAPGATGATGATNGAPMLLTAEDRRKILELARQTANAQTNAVIQLAVPDRQAALLLQRESHALLLEIEKLLPKATPPPDPKQDKQEKQEKQEGQKKESQPQQNRQPEQQPEQKPEQQPPPEPKEPEDNREKTPEEVRQILEKALQREKEHEQERRRRNETIPMAPQERDW
jgi:hypothetical protein